MLNPILTKNYIAGAAIPACSIVKFGANDTTVIPGAANTDFTIGVTTSLAAANGDRVDVIFDGVAEVVYGGTVTRGQPLMSNATGQAITAVPGAGVRIIGIALQSGAAGDIGSVIVDRGIYSA
jgi:hypothetical protein